MQFRDEIGFLTRSFNGMVESLKRRQVELQTIYQISQQITASLELDQISQAMLEQVRRMIAYDAAEICLYDQAEGVLRVQAWANLDRVLVNPHERVYRMGEGYTGWVGEQRQSLLIPDVDTHSDRFPTIRQLADGVLLNGYLGVPLVANQKIVGTLGLISARKGVFNDHDRQLLETIAPQAAIAVQNAALMIERERHLKEEIAQLRIEINEVKKARQVAEITETEYFRDLQQRAKQMRTRC